VKTLLKLEANQSSKICFTCFKKKNLNSNYPKKQRKI